MATSRPRQHVACSQQVRGQLWPPKARPLYFTAVINFLFRQYRRKTSHGISTKLVWSGVDLQMRNAPQNFGGLSQIWGANKHKILTTFRDFRTRHRISPEWNVASTNENASDNLQLCPLKVDLPSVTFDQKRKRIQKLKKFWKARVHFEGYRAGLRPYSSLQVFHFNHCV